MDIYIVVGSVTGGKYDEAVNVFQGMEEKDKSYVKKGKRINKSSIGKLEEGNFYGQYKIALLDKNEVGEARRIIKEAVSKYVIKKYEAAKRNCEGLNEHSLDDEIEFYY